MDSRIQTRSECQAGTKALSGCREKDLARLTAHLKALAHPLRLRILALLVTQEYSIIGIALELGVPRTNVAQHLAILEKQRLISARRFAQRSYYSIVSSRELSASLRYVFERESGTPPLL
jgi:DNA-binding transcriptional ArsR family regulator